MNKAFFIKAPFLLTGFVCFSLLAEPQDAPLTNAVVSPNPPPGQNKKLLKTSAQSPQTKNPATLQNQNEKLTKTSAQSLQTKSLTTPQNQNKKTDKNISPIPTDKEPNHSLKSKQKTDKNISPIPTDKEPNHPSKSKQKTDKNISPIPTDKEPNHSLKSKQKTDKNISPIPSDKEPNHPSKSKQKTDKNISPIPTDKEPKGSFSGVVFSRCPIPTDKEPNHSLKSKQKTDKNISLIPTDKEPNHSLKSKQKTDKNISPISTSNINPILIPAKTIPETEEKKAPVTKEETGEISTDPPGNDSRFLEFGLEYPINFGLHLKYQFGDSFYARMGLGFMHGFFLDSFERLSPSFGWLNQEEAKLISDTFENSLYLDFRLAWSPYFKESGGGPYLELGLSRLLYGKGKLTGINLIKATSSNSFEESASYLAKTNTYNATFHIGYQIPLEKLKLNIEVGLIRILTASIVSEPPLTAEKLFNEKQEIRFKKFLKDKGWIFPTVSGWISFAF